VFLGFLLNITDFLRQLLQRVFEARVLALQLCSGFWLALPICFHNTHRKGSDHTLLLLRVNLLLAGHDDLVELTAQCQRDCDAGRYQKAVDTALGGHWRESETPLARAN
jgi:hypothetical protein